MCFMTTYEKFKAGVLLCLALCLLSIGVAIYRLSDAVAATPGKLSATLDHVNSTLTSFNAIGPQAVATLRTLQSTTDAVGKQTTASLKVTDHAAKTLDGATTTLDNINRLCHEASDEGVDKPCGTLADVNRTLATVRGTFGQIEIAAHHEDRNLSTLDAQEAQLYADFHATTTNLNALVASPDVARFLKSSADTSVQVAAIATDVHKEADALTAPKPWYTKLGAYGTTGVNVACLVTHSCPF
jgi:hypothetical protein